MEWAHRKDVTKNQLVLFKEKFQSFSLLTGFFKRPNVNGYLGPEHWSYWDEIWTYDGN